MNLTASTRRRGSSRPGDPSGLEPKRCFPRAAKVGYGAVQPFNRAVARVTVWVDDGPLYLVRRTPCFGAQKRQQASGLAPLP
jgi:hypothetical protein